MRYRILICLGALMLLVAACSSTSGSGTASASSVNADQNATDQGESTSSEDAPSEPAADEGDAASSSADQQDSETATSPGETSDEADIVRTDDDETVNDSFVSPIFDALGFDPNDRQAAQEAYVREAEELVRQCMANSGFDYVPNISGFAPSFTRQLELNETISSQQFIDEYGFGIATLLELDFQEDGVVAFVELLLGPPPTEARSEGEQAAYELALSGETIQGLSPEDAQDEAFDNFGGQDGSCRAEGYQNADNTIGEKFDGLFTVLGDEYDAIFEQVENDPRIRELNATWQTCMAESGYSYENTQEIVDALLEDGDSLRTRFQSSPEALTIFAAAGEANLAAMNADQRFEFLEQNGAFQGFSLVPSLQAELDELIEFELGVAARNIECSDTDLVLEVQIEYEQAFVAQHATQLELIASGDA